MDERLFLIYGLISTVAVTAILIQSVSVIRQAAYETFLHLHQALAAAAIAKNYSVFVASTTRNPDRAELLRSGGAGDIIVDTGHIAGEVQRNA